MLKIVLPEGHIRRPTGHTSRPKRTK